MTNRLYEIKRRLTGAVIFSRKCGSFKLCVEAAVKAGANLVGADLGDADLAGALKIDPADIPVIPMIDAAIEAAIDAGGTLNMRTWHGSNDAWCGTEHCRAGWAVHLAGKPGKALEDRVGAQMAATLIYHASRPGQSAPRFFDSNEGARADIRKCAAEQRKGTP